MASCAVLGLTSPALANPDNGLVTAGSADITSSGNELSIRQHTDRAVIDWRTFNIGKGEATTFYQNSASSVALNRVKDANPSQILGTLNANGKVVLINPNGVFFGKDSVVDVGGLVATTADIDNDKFMQGGTTLHFDRPGNPDAKIVNEGRITAKEAGLVGLVAPNVSNSGVITARMGRVSLASGDTFTADLYGDGLIEVAVSDTVTSQVIENSGKIEAAGGTIQIEAGAGRSMVNSLVTVSGELKAPAAVQRGGKIIIGAKGSNAVKGNVTGNKGGKTGTSTVVVKAKIDASGYAAGQKGGTIEITGDHVTLANGARLNASGDVGGGDIKIGGDYQGIGVTPAALKTVIEKDAFIVNSALTHGDGGRTIVWSDGDADINGTFMNRGASGGKGGFLETSGKKVLTIGSDAVIDVGIGGEWFLDPEDIVISDSGNDNNAATSDIATSTINATLNSGGNVTITTNAGASGSGDITLTSANINKSTANNAATLMLRAYRNIIMTGSSINSTSGNALNTVFNADYNADLDGAVSITNSTITTNGGYFVAGGGSGMLGGTNGILGDGDGTGADDVAAWGNSTYREGVLFNNGDIATSGGNIFITGKAWDSTAANSKYGVSIRTGSLIRADAGSIAVKGTGGDGAGTLSNYGVYISGAGSTLLTNGTRRITVNGTGGNASSSNNFGVRIDTSGSIEATGTGDIDITGNASGTGNTAIGISLFNGATVTGAGGLITMTGNGSASGGLNSHGIYLESNSKVTNSGDINLTGTGGGTGASSTNYGVYVSGTGSSVTTTGSGNITVNGTGGNLSGTGGSNNGVVASIADALKTTGSGSILITAAKGGNGSFGFFSNVANAVITSGTGNITLLTDTLNNATESIFNAIGALTIAPKTAGATMAVGTTGSTLNLTNAYLDILLGGSYAFGSAASGSMTVNTTKDFGDKNVTFKSGNDINLARTLIKASGTGVANYIFEAARNIYNSSAALAGINAASGMINLVFNADRDGNQSGAINLTSGTITTNGGYAVFGGGSGALGGANGILGDGDGTGADDVAAWGNSLYNAGILFSAGNVTAGSGKIILRGNGYNASLNNLYGVSLISGSILESTTGSIMVAGTGGNGNDLNYGIHISGSGAGIQSQKGAIKVSGTGGSNGTADSNDNIGVYIGATSKIESLGTASDASTITIDGQSPTNGDLGNNGVMIINATVTSKEGDIRINGTGRVRDFSRGVFFNGNAKVLSTGNAKIYLTGNSKSDIFSFSTGNEIGGASALGNIYMNADTVDLGGAMNVQTAGTVYVQPRTASTSIGLGGGTGTLNLTDAELAMFNAGTLVLGDSALGTGDIDLDSWDLSGKIHSVEIYGNDIDIGGLTLGTGGFKAYAKNNGSDVGDLVISAAMTKSVSGSSLLDLRADNNITNSGYNITASTGSLNTTLTSDYENNGVGTIQLGGATVTSNGGAITIAKPLTLTGNTVLSAAGGNISLGTVDGAYNFTASGNTLAMTGALGGTTALNDVSLTSVNTMTLPSVRASAILARTTGATADLIVPVGKTITASGSGTAVTLVAARNFLNQSATPLAMTGGGRWLVYSTDTTGTQLNGLSPSFVRYSCTYGGACPAFTSETGNGALYSFTPLLTVTPNALSTTYGDAAPSLSGYGYVASGYLSMWDQANIGLSGSLQGSTNYAQGSNVGVYDINYASGSLANALGYGFTYASRTGGLTVNQRVLTASLTGTVSKIYDGLTDAVLSAGNYVLSNVYNNETLGMTHASAVYDTKDAGMGKNVSVTGLTLTGAGASNYTLSSTNASGAVGTIDKRGLSVNGIGIAGKTYNGNAAATITGTAGLANTVSGDNILLNAAGAAASFADANAGLNKSVTVSGYSLNGTDAGNYTLSQPTELTATIAKKTLNAIADNITTTYGNSVPAGNISYHGFISGENASVLAAAPSVTSTQSGFANAGTYAGNYVVSGGSATNYEFNYIDGDLTVQKANLTITADNKSKTYGDTNPLLTAGYMGLVAGDTSSVVSGLNLSTAANQQSNAGTYTILASGGTANNYNVTHTNGTMIVGKTNLTITADNKTKAYGAANPTFTATYSGLKSWDTPSAVSGLTLTSPATMGSPAGNYAIAPSGGTSANYAISYVNGNLMIGSGQIIITVTPQRRFQNADNPTFTVTYSGLLPGDTPDIITGLQLATTAAKNSQAGIYDIVASGASAPNYSILYVNSKLTIDPLALPETVSMTVQDPTTASAMNGLSISGVSQPMSVSSSTQTDGGNSPGESTVSDGGKASNGQSMQNRNFIGDLVEISPELAKILVMNDTVH